MNLSGSTNEPAPGRKELAVCLVSGGMDSCVAASIAARDYRLAFLHVTYGQRTAQRERRSFEYLAVHFGAERKLVADVSYLAEIGGSSLTDQRISVSDAELNRREIPNSYVPFRNTHLLSIAVSWAEVIGARRIFIGAVHEDGSGYPDCRPEYYEAFNRLIDAGTRPETAITVVTPVIGMKKSEIVLAGIRLKSPLHLTWSCYQSEEKACGRCDSCALRLRGFQEAGIEDPIPYAERDSRLAVPAAG